jgi:C1A family cysteine protease
MSSPLPEEQSYSVMMTSIKEHGNQECETILPFPKERILPLQTKIIPQEIPFTFRFKTNYADKLKGARCQGVFSQYNTLAINEAISSGITMKPKFTIAPMKTSITFFEHVPSLSLSQDDFLSIQQQASKLPTYFNWMDNQNILRPFNQGLCGSCWAVSAAMCLSDVFMVSKKVESNPNLSTTYLLSCMPQGQCDGGDPSQAVNDMEKHGIPSSECLDYSWCTNSGCSGDPLKHFDSHNVNQYIPPCQCSSSSNNNSQFHKRYFADNPMAVCIPPDVSTFTREEQSQINYYLANLYGNVDNTGINLSKYSVKEIQNIIKVHLYTHGPVLGGFHVFKNFFKGEFFETNDIYIETVTYKGVPGVDYDDVDREWAGSHAVSIVGWGTDNVKGEEVDYWVVRNSWGESWGKMGMFKMAMYGNDPNKKYQNRVSQFEYPSIVNTDQGIGITGGVILMKAGEIKNKESSVTDTFYTNPAPTPSATTPPAHTPAPTPPAHTPEPESPSPCPSYYESRINMFGNLSFLTFLILVGFIIGMYFIFQQKEQDSFIIITQTILLLIVVFAIMPTQ